MPDEKVAGRLIRQANGPVDKGELGRLHQVAELFAYAAVTGVPRGELGVVGALLNADFGVPFVGDFQQLIGNAVELPIDEHIADAGERLGEIGDRRAIGIKQGLKLAHAGREHHVFLHGDNGLELHVATPPGEHASPRLLHHGLTEDSLGESRTNPCQHRSTHSPFG